MNIELLNSSNREEFYKVIPTKSLRDTVYRRVRSLDSNTTYYILDGNIKDRSLYCYIDYGYKRNEAKIFYWELEDSNCYIDNDFKTTRLNKIKFDLG